MLFSKQGIDTLARVQSRHKADREMTEMSSREWRDLQVKQQDFSGTPTGFVA